MSSPNKTTTESLASAVDATVSVAAAQITAGGLDSGDLFKLTGKLMEIVQRQNLKGDEKKLVVMQSLKMVANDQPATNAFAEEVLPELIDMLKFAARGGLQLALEATCCCVTGT